MSGRATLTIWASSATTKKPSMATASGASRWSDVAHGQGGRWAVGSGDGTPGCDMMGDDVGYSDGRAGTSLGWSCATQQTALLARQ